jgi:hypothetical protein
MTACRIVHQRGGGQPDQHRIGAGDDRPARVCALACAGRGGCGEWAAGDARLRCDHVRCDRRLLEDPQPQEERSESGLGLSSGEEKDRARCRGAQQRDEHILNGKLIFTQPGTAV